MRSLFTITCSIVLLATLQTQAADSKLAGTAPLTTQGDLSAQMIGGIDRFLMRQIEESINSRNTLWRRDFSSASAYDRSVETNRQRFATWIGTAGS